MDNLPIMRVLKRLSDLLYIGKDDERGKRYTLEVAQPQRAAGGVIQHQIGQPFFDPELQHANNMRVNEVCDGARLSAEFFYFRSTHQRGKQQFYCCLRS